MLAVSEKIALRRLLTLHFHSPGVAYVDDQKVQCGSSVHTLSLIMGSVSIGGFNQRPGEGLPPQIFLTLKFVVCIALKIIEIVAT